MEKKFKLKKEKTGAIIGSIFSLVIYLLLNGYVLMMLWNWLIIKIFELNELSFKEAIGLLILCDVIFKHKLKKINN